MATPRDVRVSEVLAFVLGEIGAAGRWLVADDREGRASEGLDEAADVVQWHRGAWGGVQASAEPPAGPFDGIALRLPQGHAAMRMAFHQLAARLAPDGVLVVAGANDEGIRPVPQRLLEVADETEVVATRRHCRVVCARGPKADLRADLDDWGETVDAEVCGTSMEWHSWPSLFAHGRLDPGTRLLLETLPPLEGRVLDLACGAGVIGQFLARRGDAIDLELSDVDALAVHAARLNVPGATVRLADGLPVEGGPWDVIVSNPPVHLGKERHRGVLEALAATGPHRLTRGGALWAVVQGTVPVGRLFADGFGQVARVARSRGHAVWRADAPRRR